MAAGQAINPAMKRALQVLFAISFLLTGAPARGNAAVEDSPLRLARLFPRHTQIYAESEISALASLDELLGRLAHPFLPAEDGQGLSLRASLDALLPGDVSLKEQSTLFGERIALGIARFELATSTQLLAIEIRDAGELRRLLDEALAEQLAEGELRVDESEQGRRRYLPASALLGSAYEIRADALLIASAASAFLAEDEATLRENQRLLAAHANLPAPPYDGVLLVDGEALLLRALGEALVDPALGELLPPLGRRWPMLIAALGDGALGFQRADADQPHRIDLALRPRPVAGADFPAISHAALPQDAIAAPMMAAIPAAPALALFGRNLGADIEQFLATITGWSGWLAAADALREDLLILPHLRSLLALALQTAAGLALEADLLAHLRGDYALYLSERLPDFALLSESADHGATAATFAQLRNSLEFYDAASDHFRPPLALPANWPAESLALWLGWQGETAVLRHGLPSAAPGNPSFRENRSAMALVKARLPNSQTLLYLDGARLRDWLAAIDPALGTLAGLGEAALSLRWQEGVFALRLLLPAS